MNKASFAAKSREIGKIIWKATCHVLFHNGWVKLIALLISLVLWAGLILLAAFLAWLHYTRRSLMAKYIGGRRAANTEFARNLPEYKRMEHFKCDGYDEDV